MRTYLRERLRRRPIALALALACSVTMAGCNSGFTNVIETAHSALLPPEDITLSNDVIEALPYAASYIQLQDYSRAVMVLNYDDSGVLKWSAGPHEVIATRYGRVVFTRNINDAPQFTANQQADPLGCVRNTIRANSEANTQANTQANTEFSECQQSWIRDIEVGTPIQGSSHILDPTLFRMLHLYWPIIGYILPPVCRPLVNLSFPNHYNCYHYSVSVYARVECYVIVIVIFSSRHHSPPRMNERIISFMVGCTILL